jgi:serine phosphatase RsbU (regulator of sigma subunit)
MVAEMVRRAAADRKERERLGQEIEAARQVQSLLIAPPEGEVHPYRVEAAYLPAQEVGGDFYEVWRSTDGALLAVVGDVSGKGLKAAMTVSLIIGALRRENASDPVEILANLNRVLCTRGRDGGFVTCACLRLSDDGALDVVTAGHPPPFLNDAEIATGGSLPLGLIPDPEFAPQSLALGPGDSLTLISDGVVEAEDGKRELFGFARTMRLCGKSARDIAETAKAWGQTDDITVVTLRRTA